MVQPQTNSSFGVSVCLSVRPSVFLSPPSARFWSSKWIHFNNGDEGVKRLLDKVYKSLNDGGCFVFEFQEWSSYKYDTHTHMQRERLHTHPAKQSRCCFTPFRHRIPYHCFLLVLNILTRLCVHVVCVTFVWITGRREASQTSSRAIVQTSSSDLTCFSSTLSMCVSNIL